ncbi:hypothetical protein N7520_008957 [Penicillium odoratum]|uniref:uncharacterized protein n=1 Tax=Penicillium odoratum TaxID=1167516 RepID=UPI0025497C9E|nr:uncharacterized protein N7520_008957 [Penicillium odoratum]KAJ5752040.1 hypothetical protein N7520_008957 [Penicillium odoratum]
MEPDISDPVDWSVNEVVSFLCGPRPAPWAQSSSAPRPDPTTLEAALRDNEICGEVLMHVDNDGLKEIGVKAYGHRIMLMKAIQWLQEKSFKYSSTRRITSNELVMSRPSSPYPHDATPVSAVMNPNPASVTSQGGPAIQAVSKPKRRIAPILVQDQTSQALASQKPTDGALTPSQAAFPPQQEICTNIANIQSNQISIGGLAGNNHEGLSRTEKEENFLSYLQEKYAKDDDDILPKYGDSNSEAEFDQDTWKEILEENPDLIAAPGLPREKCEAILAQYIAEQEELWVKEELPKLLPEAEPMWHYFRDCGKLQEKKLSLSSRIEHLESRLRSVKQAIMDVSYRSTSTLRRACRAIDLTIWDKCSENWWLNTLDLDICPPPAPRPTKISKPRKERDVESVSAKEGEDNTLTSDAESHSGESIEEKVDLEQSTDEDELDLESPLSVKVDDLDTGVPSKTPRAQGMPLSLESSPSSDDSPPKPPSKRRRVQDMPRTWKGNDRLDTRGSFYEDDDEDIELVDLTNVADQTDHSIDSIIKTPSLNPTSSRQDLATQSVIKTLPLNPNDLDIAELDDKHLLQSQDDPNFSRPRPPNVGTALPLKTSSGDSFPVSFDDESDPTQLLPPSTPLPDDKISVDTDDAYLFEMVKGMSMSSIEAKKDRIQLLAKIVMQLTSAEYQGFPAYLDTWLRSLYREKIQEAIRTMMDNERNIPGVDHDESKLSMRLSALFVSWYHCISVNSDGLEPMRLEQALSVIEDEDDKGSLQVFLDKFESLINTYNRLHPEKSRNKSSSTSMVNTTSPPTEQHSKQNLKSKKPYVPNAPIGVQKRAQERKETQDRAREAFRQERENKGLGNSDPAGHAVTFKDPVVYLNPALGEFIKPHQLNGIQFMWRELCDSEKPQGCLLAHIMGLGKTLQVISLLVTIAEAAASETPEIRAQVPERFHRSQTLILCPSFLVPNWIKEFHCWVPQHHHLGNIFQIAASTSPQDREERTAERMATIQTWEEKGGIIIMSYEMFRSFIKNDKNRLSDEQHKTVQDALLCKPNIVVADEAHKLKSEKSSISQASSRFTTMSRIAMTGSPLANNLSEYYQMIEWVAPGYLESMQVFKEKYMEPIQEGLYIDSTQAQRRASLVALQVLNGILEPKIQRADHSLIAADLPSKTELVVRITLSETQRVAYNIFIDEINKTGNFSRIWQWLAIMQLCCNHPKPFLEKLQDRSNLKQTESPDPSILDGDAHLPSNLLSRIEALFERVTDILDPCLSNRALLLDKILDMSNRIGDKVLVFSQSIPTLNYLDSLFKRGGRNYKRIDGKVMPQQRQDIVNLFNDADNVDILLISTRAGGLGLNIHGANRVVIFDFLFNPAWEDQAIGRAYRIGQTKPVYVYRFIASGTFEEIIFNKTVFKSQLTVRVVDKKNTVREGFKQESKDYLFPVKHAVKKPLDHLFGKDPGVLDKIIADGGFADTILDVTLSKAQDDENDKLSTEERKRVQDELSLEQLKRSDLEAWEKEVLKRTIARQAADEAARHRLRIYQQKDQQNRFPSKPTVPRTNRQQPPQQHVPLNSVGPQDDCEKSYWPIPQQPPNPLNSFPRQDNRQKQPDGEDMTQESLANIHRPQVSGPSNRPSMPGNPSESTTHKPPTTAAHVGYSMLSTSGPQMGVSPLPGALFPSAAPPSSTQSSTYSRPRPIPWTGPVPSRGEQSFPMYDAPSPSTRADSFSPHQYALPRPSIFSGPSRAKSAEGNIEAVASVPLESSVLKDDQPPTQTEPGN